MRSPLFFWGGGRGSREVQFCRLSYLAFPAPSPFFLSFFPLSRFLYRNIMHCCVIPPISPASHPSRTPHPLPFLSRTLLLPPPIIPGSPPLSSATLFFSQFRLSNLLWRTSIPSQRRSGYNQVSSPFGCNCPFAAISTFLNMPLSFRSFEAARKYFSTCSRLFNSTCGMVAPPFPLCGRVFHPIHPSTSEGHGEFPTNQRDKPICVLERVNTINQLQCCLTHSHPV